MMIAVIVGIIYVVGFLAYPWVYRIPRSHQDAVAGGVFLCALFWPVILLGVVLWMYMQVASGVKK
jgi:hypothetical protein